MPTVLWEIAKFAVPTGIAMVSLYFSLKDRRPKLLLRSRAGHWFVIRRSHNAKGEEEHLCRGLIEIYNASSRPNAVRRYRIYEKRPNGEWKVMDCEYSSDILEDGNEPVVCNRTPLVVPPYSGVEAHIVGFTEALEPKREIVMRVEVEDLFGRRFSTEVVAH